MLVKLVSPRCGHKFDAQNRFTGVFAQAAGDEVEMEPAEALRHIERGLATEVKKTNK